MRLARFRNPLALRAFPSTTSKLHSVVRSFTAASPPFRMTFQNGVIRVQVELFCPGPESLPKNRSFHDGGVARISRHVMLSSLPPALAASIKSLQALSRES